MYDVTHKLTQHTHCTHRLENLSDHKSVYTQVLTVRSTRAAAIKRHFIPALFILYSLETP